MTVDDDGNGDDSSLPRPGEVGWSDTGWPNSAGQLRPGRAAPPTPPGWTDRNPTPRSTSRASTRDDTTPNPALPADPAATSSQTPAAQTPAVPRTSPQGLTNIGRTSPPPPTADAAVTRQGRPDSTRRQSFSTESTGADSPNLGVFSTGSSDPSSASTETSEPESFSTESIRDRSAGSEPPKFGSATTGNPGPEAPSPTRQGGDGSAGSMKRRIEAMADRFTGVTKVDRLDASFSLQHLFANSFQRRSQQDVESELMVGTKLTTPPLSSVRAEWPQPWLFARTFLAAGAVFALLFVGWTVFQSVTLLPGLIIVGSFAMPTAVLIFFFEANLPRNVSVIAVLRMVFLGGAASLLFSGIGFELFNFPWLGATVAGVVEEPAKLLAVVLVARQVQHRFILNGMLFGAAIGAGFAAFESAGYALVAALSAFDNSEVVESIVLRGLFSPFGHVVWTAISAGALWRVTDGQRLRVAHLKDPRFWRIMLLSIALHTVWNSPIPNLLYIKFVLLGALAWLVCFSLLQEGIGQIRREQARTGPAS